MVESVFFGDRVCQSRTVLVAIIIGAVCLFPTPTKGAPTTDSQLEFSPAQIEAAKKRLKEDQLKFFRGTLEPVIEGLAITREPATQSLERLIESQTGFVNPPVENARKGILGTTFTCEYAANRINGNLVFLRTYNKALVGPTLRARPGDKIQVRLINDLPVNPDPVTHENGFHNWNTTNLHTHGLFISPAGKSDNVLLSIEPQTSFDFEFEIPKDHPSGTFWYHPHHHGSTAAQVASGMAGALIIEGGMDDLPELKAMTEQILVFQQIAYYVPKNYGFGIIELPYADQVMGPGSWKNLGHHTTINGQTQPVLQMKPGEIQRWRMIHSGAREEIILKIVKLENGEKILGDEGVLPLHQIAMDGWPTGKVISERKISLWPGYRSDILVQMPAEPGVYAVVNERANPKVSITGHTEPAYLAKIQVSGEVVEMKLPTDEVLKRFRIPSIDPKKVAPIVQKAEYGINLVPDKNKPGEKKLEFQINGQAFDPTDKRVLELGRTDKWELTSVNDVGPVTHPFHIHVNPFEVVSIKDDKGEEQLQHGPIWKDTIIIPGNWKVTMLTHYRRFTGEYVQHCHILDHEDEGMMEIISVQTKDEIAANAEKEKQRSLTQSILLDSKGKEVVLADEIKGQVTMLVFFLGTSCVHCNQQLNAIAEQKAFFEKLGARVICISSETHEANKKANEPADFPFSILSDFSLTHFRKFDCMDTAKDSPMHGTFLLDADGKVVFKSIGKAPFFDFKQLKLKNQER